MDLLYDHAVQPRSSWICGRGRSGKKVARLWLSVVALSAASHVHAFSAMPGALSQSCRLRSHALHDAGICRKPALNIRVKSGLAGLNAKVGAESIVCPTPMSIQGKIPTFFPRTDRIVALGDVHGDSYALSTVLWNAGLINEAGEWVGGDTTLVQVGDVLDRGPDEAFCLNLLMRLQKEAREVGGDVIMILGNHEVMNSDLDYRYVDPLGWLGWDEETDETLTERMTQAMQGKKKKEKAAKKETNWRVLLEKASEIADTVGRPSVKMLPPFMQGRIKALGGQQGALANLPVVVTVGSTVFCHAGLMPEVVAYGLQRLNDETSAYLRGEQVKKPALLDAIPQISPIWHREFGKDTLELDGRALEAADNAMKLLGCKRMVIGHTPQARGINCVRTPEGREIWRVDTGMSQGIAHGALETLEIRNDGLEEAECVQILRGDKHVPASSRTVTAAPELKEMTLEKELHMLRIAGESTGKAAVPGAGVHRDSLLTMMSGGRAKLASYMRPRVEV